MVSRRPKIGFHAPIKGGVHNALVVAKDTGCETVQLFSRNPRGWMAKPLTLEDVRLFRKTRRLTKLKPVLIHCNYLVNLAAVDDVFLQKSRESFREEVERALLLGVDYLVVHPGSARGACEADGIKLCATSLKIACKGLKFGSLHIHSLLVTTFVKRMASKRCYNACRRQLRRGTCTQFISTTRVLHTTRGS